MEINTIQAVEMLKESAIDVGPSTVINWAKKNLIRGWQSVSKRWYFDSESITSAVGKGAIPPPAGRQRRYTNEQREEMKRLRMAGKKLSQIAKTYNCDQSFISLVVRGLR